MAVRLVAGVVESCPRDMTPLRGTGSAAGRLSMMDWSEQEHFKNELGREGLGGSVAIYMGAILGALGLIAVPVYIAAAPQVYENPRPEPLDPLLQGPIVGSRVSTPMRLVKLRQEVIVDPKLLAELNAKVRKTDPKHHQAIRTPVRERGPALAELPERRERSGFFLFNLFGG